MSLLFICAILLSIKVHAYNYPLSTDTQDTLQEAVTSLKTICSVSCWMNWFFPEKKPQVVEITFMDSLFIWLGIADIPEAKEEDGIFSVFGIISIFSLAIGIVIYMTVTRNLQARPVEKPQLIPFLADEEDYDNNTDSYLDDEVLTMQTCSGCACQFCMDETGDMKDSGIGSKPY